MRAVKDNPAKRLRVLMAERDINTQELAYMSGVHKNTIAAIRTGETTKPNSETRYRIARALGVKVNSIWPDS
ncbi:helix-turn-helix domain-containing protein [Alicyclobacillus dauci]|uniref:Helix-turn-helix transcriptional regulator n=1 Tax=Alicyclobacillus dauci TaxID=1475485 RepID=A0ABY6ZBL0_9BACL|nr:helix-turn-helix transcriptional regulator [Alicyclobacillus dauci]WAH39485.1 helix-turn-helix transcriptional regulator [Alicyclobacillus dauci]WAH39545.1 helix-turn-helix transcriptional regulator [Alicyclobacillus dauci]